MTILGKLPGQLVLALIIAGIWATTSHGQSVQLIKEEELKYQQEAFRYWWDSDWERKLAALPTSGSVPDYRIPYSGHDYPDRGGGTVDAMRKYDYAFHDGEMLAYSWEREDVGGSTRNTGGFFRGRRRGGLFARIAERNARSRIPGWYGHCNGWTAAAIRHAEPQHSVVRNGVTFTPADIKGLLAEIYMYNDAEFLGGIDPAINPGTLHISLANWLGRGKHPIGVETALGEVVFNYPAYKYEATVSPYSDNAREVELTLVYAKSTNYEADESPRIARELYFHYVLALDEEGQIIGGRYFGDSNRIDMLWAPLQPKQGGEEGNKLGNPYLDVKEVLSIWRESVPEELRKKWWNIDPTEEDAIVEEEESDGVANDQSGSANRTVATTADDDEAAETASTADRVDNN